MRKILPILVIIVALLGTTMAATPGALPFTYKITKITGGTPTTITSFTVPQPTITHITMKSKTIPPIPTKTNIKWPTPSVGPTTFPISVLNTKTNITIITTDDDFIGPQHPLMPTSIFTKKPIITKKTTVIITTISSKPVTITLTYTGHKPYLPEPTYTVGPTTIPISLLTVKTTGGDFITPQHPLMSTSIFKKITKKTKFTPTVIHWTFTIPTHKKIPTKITIKPIRPIEPIFPTKTIIKPTIITTWTTIKPIIPKPTITIHPPIVVPITTTKNATEKYVTMYVTFILRHGGYMYIGQDYSNGTVTVKFAVYDYMPAPMVIMVKRIPVSYPATAKVPKVVGIAYHYDAKGNLRYIETIPQGGGLF